MYKLKLGVVRKIVSAVLPLQAVLWQLMSNDPFFIPEFTIVLFYWLINKLRNCSAFVSAAAIDQNVSAQGLARVFREQQEVPIEEGADVLMPVAELRTLRKLQLVD